MNVAQLHSRIDFHLDTADSARFEPWQKDAALNRAVSLFLNGKIDLDEKVSKKDFFQKKQIIRDTLYPLIKNDTWSLGAPAGNNDFEYDTVNHIITRPNGYRMLIEINATLSNGLIKEVLPERYVNVGNKRNPFKRAGKDYVKDLYYNEVENGIKLNIGDASVSSIEIVYLKNIDQISHGSYLTVDDVIPSGDIAYCYGDLCELSGSAVKYTLGELVPGGSIISYGEVIANPVELELPEFVHDSICKDAAIELTLSMTDLQKFQAMSTKDQLDNQI